MVMNSGEWDKPKGKGGQAKRANMHTLMSIHKNLLSMGGGGTHKGEME